MTKISTFEDDLGKHWRYELILVDWTPELVGKLLDRFTLDELREGWNGQHFGGEFILTDGMMTEAGEFLHEIDRALRHQLGGEIVKYFLPPLEGR